MVIGAGMTSAIMNPCRPQEMEAVRAANVLNGTDANCTNWIMTYRDHKPVEAGATAVIQPGGSMRDDEVIAAADKHGIAMVFTSVRHFRH